MGYRPIELYSLSTNLVAVRTLIFKGSVAVEHQNPLSGKLECHIVNTISSECQFDYKINN